jgi:transposase-like protein
MRRYPEERRNAVLSKLLPPYNMSVSELAAAEGISEQTLYNWRKQAKLRGQPVPGPKSTTDGWSSDAKLAAVIETAALSETELSAYCRERGLYPEQIRQWKAESLSGFDHHADSQRQIDKHRRDDKRQIKRLEKELHRKDKALAETAALLVLQKKLDALWQNNGEDE